VQISVSGRAREEKQGALSARPPRSALFADVFRKNAGPRACGHLWLDPDTLSVGSNGEQTVNIFASKLIIYVTFIIYTRLLRYNKIANSGNVISNRRGWQIFFMY
jgi:hypothetical protein